MSNLNRVGSVYNFSSPIETSGCENCKEQAEAGELLTGQVPITGAILKDWLNRDIADMPTDGAFDEAAIERYLAKNFEWRVASVSIAHAICGFVAEFHGRRMAHQFLSSLYPISRCLSIWAMLIIVRMTLCSLNSLDMILCGVLQPAK